LYSIEDKRFPNSTVHIDPLTDDIYCARDIPHLLHLGINTLVVDNLNINQDHSACMELLKNAGIYVLAQLTANGLQYRLNGQVTYPFDRGLFEHHAKIINSLQRHSNVLGFLVRLNDNSPSHIKDIPAFKAMIRDLKQYIKVKSSRPIPIGAQGVDHQKSILISEYMCCGSNEIAADFFSLFSPNQFPLNGATWCLNSTIEMDGMAENYHNFPKPVILGYGCDYRVAHRFNEVRYMYSDNMTDIFSGAIAVQWFSDEVFNGIDSGSNPTFICYPFLF
jgi:hypothetical protein